MKTFLCWGISKLEGLAALLVCFTMGILAVLKTVDIRSPKTGISVHFSYSLPMAMQIY